MATFPFELVAPERLLISEEVEAVRLPGSEGEFQVMAGHAPLLALLGPGLMEVTGRGGGKDRLFIDGGFCDVNANGCTVLAEAAVPASELSTERIDALVRDAEEAAAAMDNHGDRDEANRRIATLQSLRTAI